jgi:type I restriction enzyme S subunit
MTDSIPSVVWDDTTMERVADIVPGKTPKGLAEFLEGRPDTGRTIPFFKVGDMNTHPTTMTHSRVYVSEQEAKALSLRMLPPGAIIFPKAGGAIATNKKRRLGVPGAVDLNCMAVIPGPDVSARYLMHWFEALDLKSLSNGSVLPQIGKAAVSELPFNRPPLPTQERISDFLDDQLSSLKVAEAALLTARERAARLQHAYSGNFFLTGRPVVPLTHYVSSITAGKSFGKATRAAAENEWGIVKVSAMTWGSFRPEENKFVDAHLIDPRFEIREGDLLVSRANTEEYVGASVLVGETRPRLLLSDKSMRLSLREGVNGAWLQAVLSSKSVRQQISGLATGTKDSMRNISQKNLLSVLVPLSDSREQDQQIADYTSANLGVSRITSQLTSLHARSGALRRRALQTAMRLEGVTDER